MTLTTWARTRHHSQVLALAVAMVTGLGACGGGSGDTPTGPDDLPPASGEGGEMPPVAVPRPGDDECSVAEQNAWVYDNMLDYYYFYDQVPIVDPGTFDSPTDLLRSVRFEERDPFSFITAAQASDLEFEEGREFGLGYNWGTVNDNEARITRVITDSPFGRAGIQRGDIIVSINGRPAIEALNDREFFDEQVIGTADAPGESTWQLEDGQTGNALVETFIATEYDIDTVRHAGTFTNPAYDGVVGYFYFDRFLETSRPELFELFDEFAQNGVTDIVIDLRYNRGGRISVARQLASLVLDERQPESVLQDYRYNDKYTSENFMLTTDDSIAGLGVRNVVVLVTGGTASSSEIIASGLDPLTDVTLVGTARTSGKPYIQRGRDRCGERLNAIEAEAFNAAGASVFGGIAPDCAAADDRLSNFGRDPETGTIEGMLRAGLDFIAFGACEPFVEARARVGVAEAESTAGQGSMTQGGALLTPDSPRR